MTMLTTAPTMSAAKAKAKEEEGEKEEEEEKEKVVAQSIGDVDSEAEPQRHTISKQIKEAAVAIAWSISPQKKFYRSVFFESGMHYMSEIKMTARVDDRKYKQENFVLQSSYLKPERKSLQ